MKFDEPFAEPLLHQDLLIFPSNHSRVSNDVHFHQTTEFSTRFRLPSLANSFSNSDELRKVLITVQDCFRTQTIRMLMDSSQESPEKMMWDGTSFVQSFPEREQIGTPRPTKLPSAVFDRIFSSRDPHYAPYFVLCCAAAVIVICITVLLVVSCFVRQRKRSTSGGVTLKSLYLKDPTNLQFLLISGQKVKRSDGGYIPLNSKGPARIPHRPRPQTQSFSCARKTVLASYISFRVFYTFIFTFSVVLSMLFSLWPPVGYGASGQREKSMEHALLPANQHAASQRESETEKALNQHSTKATQLVHACQDLMIRQIIEVANELNRTVHDVLDLELRPRNSSENMFQALENFVTRQLGYLYPSVQDYVGQVRSELDSGMVHDVLRFSELLSNVYASQWLLFARRLMNTSHNSWNFNAPEVHFTPLPEHLSELRLNMSKIQFARQFGLLEAETFLLTPTRITKL